MKTSAFRLQAISVLFVLAALLLIGRLYFVQVIDGQAYADQADRQYVRPTDSVFDRGSIFFTDKSGAKISAATLKTGFMLIIDPSKLGDPETVYRLLVEHVPLDRELFFSRAARKDDTYARVARRLDEKVANEIASLDIPGVSLGKERWRFYPGGTLAAQSVGFVGYRGDTLGGQYGLERFYDETLRRDASGLYVNFFAQIFSDLNVAVSGEAREEGDIITSIEPSVERQLELELGSIIETWHAKGAGGIIMNPKTGEIYALGYVPTFDPNGYQDIKDPGLFQNPLVERVYEFGSIVKPITMAAGIDAGVVTPDTTYNDKGSLTLDGKTIWNYDLKGRGVVPMQVVLNESLNTGAAFVMQKLGKERFSTYLRAFGFGEVTEIDLPGELPGLVDNLDSPRDIEHATASYGQGIALTPVAMARALSALGNGGVLPSPHVATHIRHPLGYTTKIPTYATSRAISEGAAHTVTEMLVKVVDEALLGGSSIPGYTVAAKTGTAQIADPESGGYYADRFLHSFFGYFPAHDPKFLVFLYTIEPQEVKYASQTLTAPFFALTKFLLAYYQVPPDRPLSGL